MTELGRIEQVSERVVNNGGGNSQHDRGDDNEEPEISRRTLERGQPIDPRFGSAAGGRRTGVSRMRTGSASHGVDRR